MLTDLKKYDPNKYMRMDDQFLDILLDALAGDPKALAMPEIQSINVDNLKAALEFYANSNSKLGDYANTLASDGWRLMYKRKPPTPEEFLTYEWIGPQSEGLWPNVRKAFVEFCDPSPLNPKRGLALSTSIGWGKQNPISSNIMTNKKIKIELEDGSIKEFESDDVIDVIIEGNPTKIQANELLKRDLSKVDFPQP